MAAGPGAGNRQACRRNIIATIESVNDLLDEADGLLPDALEVTTIMDQSEMVDSMLSELLNNVLTAVVLVLIVILAAMGCALL